jgi:prophage DNA circulation protein
MNWKEHLRDASFRGVPFKVETGGYGGGRRVAPHEFPKKESVFVEDMGRRSRRFRVTAYVIGDDYVTQRDALAAALDQEGPGTLVLPTTRGRRVICEHWDCTETRTRGRVCEFEMAFYEAGQDPALAAQPATQAQSRDQATATAQVAAASANRTAAAGGNWPAAWETRVRK